MEFKDLIDGKNVLLVGNGSGIKDRGETIDSYEFVVRFNNGIIHSGKYDIGKKCDAWVYSMRSEGQCKSTLAKANILPKYCVRFFAFPPKEPLGNHVYLPRLEIYNILREEWGLSGKENPSTGISLLYYIIENCSPKSITLIGFDSFKTPNFYANRIWADTWHDSNQESAYINELISANKIKVI